MYGVEGNLAEKWHKHLYPPIETVKKQSWFSSERVIVNQGFVHNYWLHAQTCAVLGGIMFCISMFGRMKRYFWITPKKSTLNHVLRPKTYSLNTDVHTWLELFELYLDSNNVFHPRQGCNALLSRLDYECSCLGNSYTEKYEHSGFFFMW